jgi:hypothetical protein
MSDGSIAALVALVLLWAMIASALYAGARE